MQTKWSKLIILYESSIIIICKYYKLVPSIIVGRFFYGDTFFSLVVNLVLHSTSEIEMFEFNWLSISVELLFMNFEINGVPVRKDIYFFHRVFSYISISFMSYLCYWLICWSQFVWFATSWIWWDLLKLKNVITWSALFWMTLKWLIIIWKIHVFPINVSNKDMDSSVQFSWKYFL